MHNTKYGSLVRGEARERERDEERERRKDRSSAWGEFISPQNLVGS